MTCCSVGASASTIYVTYTGTLSGIYDTGLFGSPAIGDPFSLVFTFDSTQGYQESDGIFDRVYGGGSYPISSPGNAVLTIDGNSATINGDWVSEDYAQNNGDGGVSQTYQYANDFNTSGLNNYVVATIYSYAGGVFPNSILSPYSYDVTSGDYTYGYFSFSNNGITSAFGNLSLDHVDVSVSAVPLPSTLPLFASGLAGLAWLSRRKRKQTQLSA
jgi:hypothetical protein